MRECFQIRFKKQLSAFYLWLFELFHLYTVTLEFLFSTYELVVEVEECRWYVECFSSDSKNSCLRCVLITCFYHFAINQRIKWLFQLFRAQMFFSLNQVKTLVVRIVFASSRDFLVLKRLFGARPESGRDRLD